MEGDVRDAGVVDRAGDASMPCLPPGVEGGARRGHPRHRRLRRPQRRRDRRSCCARSAGPLRRASCWPPAWSSTGRGATAAAAPRRHPPGPRPPTAWPPASFEPQCPTCGRSLVVETIDEDAPLDPRSIYAATKVAPGAPVPACSPRDRRAGDRVAIPQRVRAADAPRHPVRRRGAIFRSSLEGGKAPQVFEDGRQRRDFVHVTRRGAREPGLPRRRPAASGSFNVASGTPTRWATWPRPWPTPSTAHRARWSRGSGAGATSATSWRRPIGLRTTGRLSRRRGLRRRDARVRASPAPRPVTAAARGLAVALALVAAAMAVPRSHRLERAHPSRHCTPSGTPASAPARSPRSCWRSSRRATPSTSRSACRGGP